MKQDLKEEIDRELQDAPPLNVSIDDAVAAGRRIRRRRHLFTVGGVASVVAVVSVIALVLGTGTPITNPAGAPGVAPPAAQPEMTLPELDPTKTYQWRMTGEHSETDSTKHYSQALQDGLDALYPGYAYVTPPKGVPPGDGDGSWAPVGETEPEFSRMPYGLIELFAIGDNAHGGETVHEQPIYVTRYVTDDSAESMYIQVPDADAPEMLELQVWPNGGFTGGTDGPTDLIECADSLTTDNAGEVLTTITCSEARGPHGELVRQSVAEMSHGETGDTYWRVHHTVMYRLDGTAVVVRNQVSGEDPIGTSTVDDLGDRTPAMSLADQIELAATLPGAIVA